MNDVTFFAGGHVTPLSNGGTRIVYDMTAHEYYRVDDMTAANDHRLPDWDEVLAEEAAKALRRRDEDRKIREMIARLSADQDARLGPDDDEPALGPALVLAPLAGAAVWAALIWGAAALFAGGS